MPRDEIEASDSRSPSGRGDSNRDTERTAAMDRRDYLKFAGAAVAAASGAGLAGAAGEESGPENSSDWQLSFEDTFDSGSLDTSKWGIGFGWGTETNGSPERIVEENVEVRDGRLRLKGTHDGDDYKAGSVNSKNKAYFGPGSYWEAKIKMPERVGFLPAFWAKPNDESWPPEIDFVELFQTDGSRSDTHRSHHHIHYSASTEVGDSSTHEDEPASYDAGVDLTADFHVYGCEWREDRVVHYVDGEQVAECTDPTVMEALNKGAPFYMMLNIHIDRVGTADASESWGEELVADWVRVWEYAPDSSNDDTGGDTTDDTSGDDSDDTTDETSDDTTDETSDDTTDDTTDETSDGTEHYFWVRSADGSQAEYAFATSGGEIRVDPNERNDGEDDEWVSADGTRAGGTVSGGSLNGDGFWYHGEITDLNYSGPLETYVDDQWVDPDSLVDPESSGPELPESDESPDTGSDSDSETDSDTDSDSDSETDSGSDSDSDTGSDSDSGSDSETDSDSGSDSETDSGSETDSDTDSDSDDSLPNTIVIDGSDDNKTSRYEFEVTGEVEASAELTGVDDGGTVWDSLPTKIDGQRVFGIVGRGRDGFRYSGEITSLRVTGNATVDLE